MVGPADVVSLFSNSSPIRRSHRLRLAPGIIVMQFTTIFFPVYEIFKSRSQMRATLAILKSWEDRRDEGDYKNHLISGRSSVEPPSTIETTVSSARHRELYSMASLEKALAVNPDPLLRFAASKDFTAENILFLIQVRHWREAFESAPRVKGNLTETAKSHLFNSAVQIYMSRVNDETTEFPVNIESRVRQDLDSIFVPAVPTGRFIQHGDGRYFGAESWFRPPNQRHAKHCIDSSGSATTLHNVNAVLPEPISFPAEKSESLFPPHPSVTPLGESRATIRKGFDEHVFDAAERSIKYLVLTNTWQKFVRSGEQNPSQNAAVVPIEFHV